MENESGKQYGAWTVIGEAPTEGRRRVRVRCSCGREKSAQLANLRSGRSTQCASCARRRSANRRTHGEALVSTPEYRAWKGIKQRCTNPNDASFHNYGGRGIVVCRRWLGEDGYINFLADMRRRPSAAHSIDRKDNEGDYAPSNCRWATQREQMRNTRTNRRVTIDGVTLTVVEWSEKTGARSATTIYARLRAGRPPREAVFALE